MDSNPLRCIYTELYRNTTGSVAIYLLHARTMQSTELELRTMQSVGNVTCYTYERAEADDVYYCKLSMVLKFLPLCFAPTLQQRACLDKREIGPDESCEPTQQLQRHTNYISPTNNMACSANS